MLLFIAAMMPVRTQARIIEKLDIAVACCGCIVAGSSETIATSIYRDVAEWCPSA